MPHDIDGREIKAGDRVTIECIVRTVSTGLEYCNVTMDTVEPMFPGEHKTCYTANAKQVRKVE